MNKIIYCVPLTPDSSFGFVDLSDCKFFESYPDALEFIELIEAQAALCDDKIYPTCVHNLELIKEKIEKSECF